LGTSISQKSPRTLSWQAVGTAYDSDQVPVNRICQEVWRAATNQEAGDLSRDLASPFIGSCVQIAEKSQSIPEAMRAVRIEAVSQKHASIATSLAQRAVAAAVAVQNVSDRKSTFISSLIYEASNYLVSRDISGHVGRSQRTSSVSATTSLKDSVCRRASEVASAAFSKVSKGAEWSKAMGQVVASLREG